MKNDPRGTLEKAKLLFLSGNLSKQKVLSAWPETHLSHSSDADLNESFAENVGFGSLSTFEIAESNEGNEEGQIETVPDNRQSYQKWLEKVLIIHPIDPSTAFLEDVYKNIPTKRKTIIRGGVTKEELKRLMHSHQRIIMCGHGFTGGLLAVGQFPGYNNPSDYIVDKDMVDILRRKSNSLFIWCFARRFVEQYSLPGFCTDMFVSEVAEASLMRITPLPTQEEVDTSNNLFSELLSGCIEEDTATIYRNVTTGYAELANVNAVAAYNNSRLWHYPPVPISYP
jgi:hypothetical protein